MSLTLLKQVADTTAADESSELIEATRVEKEGQSPRTPPPRAAITHVGNTATIATGGEERQRTKSAGRGGGDEEDRLGQPKRDIANYMARESHVGNQSIQS